MRKLVPAVLMAAMSSAASAQVVDFIFVDDGTRDLTTITATDPGTGLSLTIDNPRDNVQFGDNSFALILGGLFLDGGLAPTVDWTFSQDVRLIEYQLGNQDNVDLVDLVQGGVSSLGNTTITVSTFPFTNTTDTFLGGVPIVMTTSNHDGQGYSFSRIRVEIAGGTPCPGDIADDFGSLGGDGMVSFGDFLALLGLVGPCGGGTGNPDCIGDIADDFGALGSLDDMVSFGDFLALLGLVGPCP